MEVKAVPGQLAESRSGRDNGRNYLVMEVNDAKQVLLVDGIIRRVDNPKKKNCKHIILHPQVAVQVAEKLKSGQRVTNQEVRRALEDLLDRPEEQPF